VPLYQKACDRPNALACLNLALMYATGHAVERDFKRALELKTRACSTDSGSCFDLANAYYQGDGVPQDLEGAADLFERACDHADPVACYLLAGLTERGVGGRRGPKVALSLYKLACAANFQPACREEARLKGARSRSPR
jgi:TPR repeat protein